MPIWMEMARNESDSAGEAVPVPGDLAGSLASSLLWLDVATLSLERDDLRDLKAALTQARAQLHAVVEALTTADRRTADRRMGQKGSGDGQAPAQPDRRSGERRDKERRTMERRGSGS